MTFLYIHGFNSSSASIKARILREELLRLSRGDEFIAPDLPHRPRLAIQKLEREILQRGADQVVLIGSSLGGHYATWLAEEHGLPAVLVNPVVDAHRLLATWLGAQKNVHTGEQYQLTPQHLQELEQCDTGPITRPNRYLLLVQTGDEVLDYRQAVEKYRGARQVVIQGGDHGFADFSSYVPVILEFAAEKLREPATKRSEL